MKKKQDKVKQDRTVKPGHMYKKSLKNKILLPFLVLIILTGAIISVVSYRASVDTTIEALTGSVQSQMDGLDGTFEMYFHDVENTLNHLSSNPLIVGYVPSHKSPLLNLLSESKETRPSILSLYMGTKDAKTVLYPQVTLDDDYNPTERGWYQDAAAAEGDIIWTDAYTDAFTGKQIVTAAKAFYQGSELEGVVAADVSLEALIDMTDDINIGDNGYAVLFDNAGHYLSHPDDTYVGKDESQEAYYQTIVDTGERGSVEYQFEDEDKVMAIVKNSTTGWILGGAVHVEDFEKDARTIIKPILMGLGGALVIAIIASAFIARRITAPIQTVMERMKAIADGDLSQEPLRVTSEDETGQLVLATNEMNEKMRNLLSQIHDVSETVSGQSEELTQSSNEVKAGSEQVATTMQELAAGSETQAQRSGDLATAMQSFVKDIEVANENGEHIRTHSKRVLQMTGEGSELMDVSKAQMDHIHQIVQDAFEKVQGLDRHAQDISKLISVIQDIADQTNLLALNAAIEAARAGEQGKGFAVVADEVRKLAEQVSDSVSDITDIVTRIQSESTVVTDSLQIGYKEVEEGTNQIEKTGVKFSDINQAVMNMVDNVQAASDSLKEIAASSQQMSVSIEDVAAITEESAAGIEETSASSEQTSAIMEEVAESSNDLAKLAEQLNDLTHQFKI
ncbi:methyl-accepting chemotaxis protein [Lentibacillus saliphilus]|uniref:methyl-accepting chemotaxis protein n=1 Tax=Lentibacillus saliphilus TaxID=2737028 RepID=UPI001C310EEE|nr:methyl-accepting chemotaxis protein [Lentibacillus saliphilus]